MILWQDVQRDGPTVVNVTINIHVTLIKYVVLYQLWNILGTDMNITDVETIVLEQLTAFGQIVTILNVANVKKLVGYSHPTSFFYMEIRLNHCWL